MAVLDYNPGVIPTKSAPTGGEIVSFEVDGLPPYKDLNRSIRNNTHIAHSRFVHLRAKCAEAMAGRAWSKENIFINLIVCGPPEKFDRPVYDYLSGVMDSLDGSSGKSFTYLPIAFEDDCQVKSSEIEVRDSKKLYYQVSIKFGDEAHDT